MSGLSEASLMVVLDRSGQLIAATGPGREFWRLSATQIGEWCGRSLAGEFDFSEILVLPGKTYRCRVQASTTSSGPPTAVIVTAAQLESRPWALQGELDGERYAALCRLVAGLTHELRNPLASISLTAELLAGRLADDDARERLRDIVHHVDRAEELLDSFRRFSREEDVGRRLLSLNALIHDAVRLEQRSLSAGGVEIALELDPELPEVLGDPSQLRLVASNLLRNAAEAVASTNRAGRVRVHTSHRHGVIRLTVEDDGPGIPVEHVSRVFEPRFTTKDAGNGLGLAMVQGVVKSHGGHAWVDPSYRRGARFSVDLPDPRHSTPAVHRATLGIELMQGPSHAVLLVDADDARRERSRRAISAIGWKVHVASSVDVALRKLRASDFDAVLVASDLGADTIRDLTARVRAACPELATRMGIVSACAADVDGSNWREAGLFMLSGTSDTLRLQSFVRLVAGMDSRPVRAMATPP